MQHVREYEVKYRNTVRDECQNKVKSYLLEHPCVDCGKKDIRVLQFDHLGNKKLEIGKCISQGYKWTMIELEISKCEVRCANCHIIKHRPVRWGYSGEQIVC